MTDPKMTSQTAALEAALTAAKQTRTHAHAPYSNFWVGASLKVKGHDDIFTGCNVENASYGATVCAERVAIWTMVSALGTQELEWMVLITDTDPVATPCGMCLQVISEFASPELPINLANLSGIQSTVQLSDLLGQPFNPDSLQN